MSEYLLGIDNGNTISKAAIFDLQGREIQVTSRQVKSDFPHKGWTERSMDELWQSTASTIKDALSKSGIKPEHIIGIGTTGHGNGLYLIDKEGIVRHEIVNDLGLGRNVEETLRMLDALQFTEKHGEVCPANWRNGDEAMKPTAEGVAEYLAKHA